MASSHKDNFKKFPIGTRVIHSPELGGQIGTIVEEQGYCPSHCMTLLLDKELNTRSTYERGWYIKGGNRYWNCDVTEISIYKKYNGHKP